MEDVKPRGQSIGAHFLSQVESEPYCKWKLVNNILAGIENKQVLSFVF